jgi:hypothetical protein
LEALQERQETFIAHRLHPNPMPLLQGQSEPARSSHYNSFESESPHINNGYWLVQNFLSIKVWYNSQKKRAAKPFLKASTNKMYNLFKGQLIHSLYIFCAFLLDYCIIIANNCLMFFQHKDYQLIQKFNSKYQ